MMRDVYNPRPAKSDLPKDIFINFFNFIAAFIKFCTLIPFMTIFLFFFPVVSMAAENSVYLTSQRLEYHVPTKKIFVQGDVTMTQEGFQLTAENMELDLDSGNGMANGDVHIYLPHGYRMDTDIAEFNINTGWWRIQATDMWLKPSGYIHFEEAEKSDLNTLYLTKPRFTTCLGKSPPWEIRGRKGILRPGKSMKISHLSIRIKGVPFFYFPAAYVPIWETESTGLQPPEAGHSSRHGFFLKNRFAWPYNQHTEGRLFLDFFSRTGIGLGTGWKYTPEKDSQGSEARFYLLREDSPEKIHGKADLSVDLGRSEKKRGVIDIHYATERDYDRKFSSDLVLRDLRFGESRAFVTLQRSMFGILGEWEHSRSLIDPNNKSEVHQLPKLACHLQPTPLKIAKTRYSPLLGLRLSTLHMDWDLTEENGGGENYTIEPGLGFHVPWNHWTNLNSLFSSRQTYYQATQFEKEGWSHTYNLNLILTGPRIYKDYNRTYKDSKKNTTRTMGTYKGFRHLVYPQVSYEYETHHGIQPASMMDLEEDAREIEYVRFFIINRIWGRSSKHALSVPPTLDLVISQNMQLKEDKQALEIRVKTVPYPLVRLNGRGSFFTKGSHGSDLDLDLNFGNTDKGEISMGWRYLWDDRYNERLNTTRLLFISPSWKGYQFSTSSIYDFKTKNRIEETYSLSYKHICWKARLGFIKHIDEDLIRADLNLIF